MFRDDDVRGCLPPEIDALIDGIEVLDRVDSTNARLMKADPPAPGRWTAVIADEQTRGRGRGGSAWYSPPDAGLWLSAAHTFETPPVLLMPLTIALGIAVAAELESLGVAGIALKWPNDLIVNDRKLGGMMVETTSTQASVVLGIGINFRPPNNLDIGSDAALEPTGLLDVMEGAPSRAELAARIIVAAAETLPRFAVDGLDPWLEQWSRYDWLLGREICVTGIRPELRGVARGIDAEGRLQLRDGDIDFKVISGSIRMAEADI